MDKRLKEEEKLLKKLPFSFSVILAETKLLEISGKSSHSIEWWQLV